VEKINYNWDDLQKCAHKLALQMYQSRWRPDYIVGLNRGGLPLSVVLSHLLDVTHYALDVRLRDNKDGTGPESNLWMAEDAFGYVNELDRDGIFENLTSHPDKKKNILVVDDINDTGATFNWIKQDWQSGCLPDHPNWDTVWGKNVRFAVMCEKTHTTFGGVDYIWKTIDTGDGDPWIVFPWEYD